MAEGMREDRFANIAAGEVVMSAANTLTFVELLTGVSLGQGVGMLIDEIDYFPGAGGVDDMTATGDTLTFAVTTSNEITAIADFEDRRIIHSARLHQNVITSGGGMLEFPLVRQFFPPIITATPRLYLAADSTGLAAAATVKFRIYFRFVSLSAQQYLELAESFILVG